MRLLLFFLMLSSVATAQSGYRLDFKTRGWSDTTFYLGFYYGESSRIKDTARADAKGEFHFAGRETLPQGVYYLVLGSARIFDFVVGEDQFFSIESSRDNYLKTITGDEDNSLYYENQLFLIAQNKDAAPLIQVLQDTNEKDVQKKKDAQEAFSRITQKVRMYQNEIIVGHPTTMTARIIRATLPIYNPPPPLTPGGAVDTLAQIRYYRRHFFDNFDLGDDAMLRMSQPVYEEKVKDYLEKLYPHHPDSVMTGIHYLVSKARRNPETYKYLVYTCGFLYQSPPAMGMDQVFVDIYQTYFATGEMDYWANGMIKQNFRDQAERIGRATIGSAGPNLILRDVRLKPHALYDIKKKFTILFFFDPECAHCLEETPKLREFYDRYKKKLDLEVYAVARDSSLTKLQNFITQMKTTWVTVDGPRTLQAQPYTALYDSETYPTIYILDEKKNVIARKLPADALEFFFKSMNRL